MSSSFECRINYARLPPFCTADQCDPTFFLRKIAQNVAQRIWASLILNAFRGKNNPIFCPVSVLKNYVKFKKRPNWKNSPNLVTLLPNPIKPNLKFCGGFNPPLP
jgi:hypothetical protein